MPPRRGGHPRRDDSTHSAGPALTPGGIHPPNVPLLLHGSIAPNSRNCLDGVAVISAIVGSDTPEDAARGLRKQVDSFKRARKALGDSTSIFTARAAGAEPPSVAQLIDDVVTLMDVVRQNTPLVHQVGALLRC